MVFGWSNSICTVHSLAGSAESYLLYSYRTPAWNGNNKGPAKVVPNIACKNTNISKYMFRFVLPLILHLPLLVEHSAAIDLISFSYPEERAIITSSIRQILQQWLSIFAIFSVNIVYPIEVSLSNERFTIRHYFTRTTNAIWKVCIVQ